MMSIESADENTTGPSRSVFTYFTLDEAVEAFVAAPLAGLAVSVTVESTAALSGAIASAGMNSGRALSGRGSLLLSVAIVLNCGATAFSLSDRPDSEKQHNKAVSKKIYRMRYLKSVFFFEGANLLKNFQWAKSAFAANAVKCSKCCPVPRRRAVSPQIEATAEDGFTAEHASGICRAAIVDNCNVKFACCSEKPTSFVPHHR